MNPPDENAVLDDYLYRRHDRPEHAEAPTPRGHDLVIQAVDGFPLAATLWESPIGRAVGPRRVTVCASATGVKRGFYARFAEHLRRRGHTVITFDYRGIGASVATKGSASPRMVDWGDHDLASVVDWATRVLDVPQVNLVGHSVGGQLVGLLPRPEKVRAFAAVAAQSGDYRLWPMPLRLGMALVWYGIVPSVTHTMGYLPGALGIGEDLPAGVALEWAEWCRTPGYMVGGPRGDRRRGFERLRCPILAFDIEGDPYAPAAAVDALLALYRQATIRRRHVARSEADLGHFGFFRAKGQPLWDELARFLEEDSH